MRYGRPRKEKKKDPLAEDPFIRLHTYIPVSVYKVLQTKSEELKQPISKLIAIGCFNEAEESASPFVLDVTLPVEDFVLGKFEHEAELLRRFLMHVPGGIGLEQLVMLKDEIGLSAKKILLAYMELRETGRVEEYYPRASSFDYDPEYRYIRLIKTSRAIMNRQRFKTLAGEATRTKKV